MQVIAIAAVTAGGKTTAVQALQKKLPRAAALFFDDYDFDGAVENYYQWVLDGTDYNVWDLTPLKRDLLAIRNSGLYDFLFLDYPFAYCHDQIKSEIDFAVFIDTPLDIALARRVLRNEQNASADTIRANLEMYLKYGRIAYVQMLKDILPASDYVVDGAQEPEAIVEEILSVIPKK